MIPFFLLKIMYVVVLKTNILECIELEILGTQTQLLRIVG